jgi:hypothetical protein
VQVLKRCRELRDEAAQRARAHAAFHARRAQTEEQHRRDAAQREATRQQREQGQMMQRLLQQEALPQAVGALLARHEQRRDVHRDRIDQAVQMCHHMDRHLDYARRVGNQCARALERASMLCEDAAEVAIQQAERAAEAIDDDFVTAWSHGKRARA